MGQLRQNESLPTKLDVIEKNVSHFLNQSWKIHRSQSSNFKQYYEILLATIHMHKERLWNIYIYDIGNNVKVQIKANNSEIPFQNEIRSVWRIKLRYNTIGVPYDYQYIWRGSHGLYDHSHGQQSEKFLSWIVEIINFVNRSFTDWNKASDHNFLFFNNSLSNEL